MVKSSSITDRRFIYSDDSKPPLDVHDVRPKRTSGRGFFVLCFVILLSTRAMYLFVSQAQESSLVILSWSFLAIGFLYILHLRKSVKKESVVIMPGFGVQLETHYARRTVCRFIPIDKILRPILLECVTPITCYWCLSLVLRDEAELMLVFKELRPPVKILTPIWKALCGATDTDEGMDFVEENSECKPKGVQGYQ